MSRNIEQGQLRAMFLTVEVLMTKDVVRLCPIHVLHIVLRVLSFPRQNGFATSLNTGVQTIRQAKNRDLNAFPLLLRRSGIVES